MSPTPNTGRLDPDRLAALEEQRDFLLRSLDDLQREYDAGDLDPADFETLRDDYTVRAAEVLRALEQQRDAFDQARRPRPRAQTALVIAGVALFAVVSGFMVARTMGARKAGESSSGGVSVKPTLSQQANECRTQMATDPDATFACLKAVLDKDDKNAVALTWSAWLLSLSAPSFEESERITAQALAAVYLDSAVESDPNYTYARAFRAIVAYRNGRYVEARKYLDEFKANDPSAEAAQIIKQMGLEANIDKALAAEN